MSVKFLKGRSHLGRDAYAISLKDYGVFGLVVKGLDGWYAVRDGGYCTGNCPTRRDATNVLLKLYNRKEQV